MRMMTLILLLLPTSAIAQEFVPITIDAAKYQQIDEAMAQLAMPRQAHIQWQQLWQQLERQAAQEKAVADAKAKNFERPVAGPPGK